MNSGSSDLNEGDINDFSTLQAFSTVYPKGISKDMFSNLSDIIKQLDRIRKEIPENELEMFDQLYDSIQGIEEE